MRIRELWIDSFKNLRDFHIRFGDHLTTVLIGQNGTGKSNLLEALAIIFRDLDLETKNRGTMPFAYDMTYECRGHEIEVDGGAQAVRARNPAQLPLLEQIGKGREQSARLRVKVNGRAITKSAFFRNKQQYLPKHVFGYYSGPTNRLAQHFDEHQKRFYDEQRRGQVRPLRPLFFALPVHSQFVLLAYYAFPDQSGEAFLRDYLGIGDFDSTIFVIREPDWKRPDSSEDPFWGATGIPREFLNTLFESAMAPSRSRETVTVATGKSVREQHLYLPIVGADTLRKVAQSRGSNREFFKDLDTLYISRLIHQVIVKVRRIESGELISFPELSEGEQQLLTVLGLLKFTSDTESLFLLDEPDTHLNPAWKLEYLSLIEPIVGDDTQCQVIMATHDPIVIGSCRKEQVRILAFDEGKHSDRIRWYEPDEDPRGMGVAALLTSDVFGLRTSLDVLTQEKLDRKRTLAAKQPDELTHIEREELQKLNRELEGLGFTYSFRDPLYQQFAKVMTRELLTCPELMQPVLTKEQKERRDEIAREIIASLRNTTASEDGS